MASAGGALGRFDVVHGRDRLVARAAAALARHVAAPYVTTIHSTEHGRHQGWVERHPQSHIHARERCMTRRARRVIVCTGAGPHRAELEAQARRLGLTAHGAFPGWIGDDLLHALYRTADLCVVPSLYEPFGLVALEAMARGCPCIVADTGGLREVVPNDDVGLPPSASISSPRRAHTCGASSGPTSRAGRRPCTATSRGRGRRRVGPSAIAARRCRPDALGRTNMSCPSSPRGRDSARGRRRSPRSCVDDVVGAQLAQVVVVGGAPAAITCALSYLAICTANLPTPPAAA